ncbi:hypothetical protein H632_c415p2 [Helicosporidium sp. ATCC 50920]|nr:hypothetical protein H632_c415p2 [Helicosporidium sp. ATCC 50920]|eukprot:KDD75967.1 hypothetical protein H632_c415p2 [Helicosporidium sp. ATCC 50920]
MRLSLVQTLESAHEDSIWTAAWSPKEDVLVTGSVDESVKLWQAGGPALEQQHQLLGVEVGAVSVAVDSLGEYGAVCSMDAVVNVWSQSDFGAMARLSRPPAEAWGCAFRPRSSSSDPVILALAGGNSSAVYVLTLASRGAGEPASEPQASLTLGLGRERKAASAAEDEKRDAAPSEGPFALSVACSPDGKILACGSMDGGVTLFDLQAEKLLGSLSGHFKPVRGLAFTPDSKHLLTACDDQQVNMYDVTQSAQVATFSGHESWVLGVSVHPSGESFVSACSDSKVRLFDLQARTLVQTVGEHKDQVWDVAFNGTGNRVASVSDDSSICLWEYQ